MTDAGFFRGTSADQDNRFANKQKKLLKELNFSPILATKLNMTKIDVNSLKPWIEGKIKDVLEKDDEILSESIYEHLAEKEPDGRNILLLITGFVDEAKASKFMEELWTKLIDLQDNSNGVSKSAASDNADSELKSTDNHGKEESEKPDELNESNNNSKDDQLKKDSHDERRSSGSSHSVTPPSRSVSKSPGNYKLDEHSRGRPRKRLQDGTSRDGSEPPAQERGSRSRSRSSARSRSASATKNSPRKLDTAAEPRRSSRTSSHSKRSGSRSRSRSYSRSKSRSKSRSSSRSPRNRSRSPYGHSFRGGRRSRSPSRGYRPRSRSPRGRRGFAPRGTYRGSFNSGGGYHDRRRGPIGGPIRRRPSPWGRRRFSPRSPPRRRRTPSFSPRRRRSPSPYSRRRSRSRSPPGHMMNRNIPSPRPHMSGGGHLDMMGGRHMQHHDMHPHTAPLARSPRGPIEHRGYGDGQLLPRHSPGPAMNKLPDQLPSHGLISSQPGPSGSGLYSPPSSGRKKHKKEKKHRKHKKSKKHRSASPEKKKKHKKHKKTKKHK